MKPPQKHKKSKSPDGGKTILRRKSNPGCLTTTAVGGYKKRRKSIRAIAKELAMASFRSPFSAARVARVGFPIRKFTETLETQKIHNSRYNQSSNHVPRQKRPEFKAPYYHA